MTLFIDRENELETLNWLLGKKTASLVVIKGRRRIGKSTLVEYFCKKFRSYTFIGIPPNKKTTKQSQLDEFSRQIENAFGLSGLNFNDWSDAFHFVAEYTKKGRVILVLDEISWIGSKDANFMGKLKTMWDTQFKKNDKLILIICGSVSAWIEDNIIMNTGFVGRISSQLQLKELSLNACNKFWGKYAESVSNYEKFKILAITGGVPRYLEEMRPELTAEENIRFLCFNKSGFLFHEFDRIFNDSLLSHSGVHRQMLQALIKAKYEPSALCKKIGSPLNSVMTRYIHDLIQAGFVSREYTWDLKSTKKSILSHLRIRDNYVRFYLQYIEKNATKIESGLFDNISISSLPAWNSIMGLQFEALVLNNRKQILKILKIPPEDIVCDGPFFQTQSKSRPGCQIDYLIQTKFNNIYIVEIKFSKHELKASVVKEVEQKIKSLSIPKNYSYRAILIHVNGVDDNVRDSDFFANIIDFGVLLMDVSVTDDFD